MSVLEVLQGYQPTDNDERKLYEGDTVAQISEIKTITTSAGKDWMFVVTNATHPVEPKAGKNNNIQPGEEISKLYDPDDADSIRKFANDMFTAGIEIDASSEEAFEASKEAAVGKLIYLRCWTYDKKSGDGKGNSIAIKSKKLITPELAVPIVPGTSF